MMMKIEKLLTISDKMKDGKKKEMARVQDFDIDDMKKLDKTKFKKGKSQRGIPRLESDCLVILKDDFEEYEKDMKSEIDRLKSAIEEKDKSIESLQNRLSSIDDNKEEKIKNLEDEYSGKIDKLNEDLHEKDLEIERTRSELIEKYERIIGDFKAETQKDLNKLELFDEEKHMLIKDHDQEISKLNIFNPEYHMKKEDHQKELNKMRGNCLKLRVRENAEYSSYIEELDSLGRFEKLMNKDKSILNEMKKYNKTTINDKAIDVNFNLIDKEK